MPKPRGRPPIQRAPCLCGCGVLAGVRGYAYPCYQRERTAGRLDTRIRGGRTETRCTMPKCKGAWYCKGLCVKHYRRRRAYARLTYDESE